MWVPLASHRALESLRLSKEIIWSEEAFWDPEIPKGDGVWLLSTLYLSVSAHPAYSLRTGTPMDSTLICANQPSQQGKLGKMLCHTLKGSVGSGWLTPKHFQLNPRTLYSFPCLSPFLPHAENRDPVIVHIQIAILYHLNWGTSSHRLVNRSLSKLVINSGGKAGQSWSSFTEQSRHTLSLCYHGQSNFTLRLHDPGGISSILAHCPCWKAGNFISIRARNLLLLCSLASRGCFPPNVPMPINIVSI